jgi:hypothetical protein
MGDKRYGERRSSRRKFSREFEKMLVAAAARQVVVEFFKDQTTQVEFRLVRTH